MQQLQLVEFREPEFAAVCVRQKHRRAILLSPRGTDGDELSPSMGSMTPPRYRCITHADDKSWTNSLSWLLRAVVPPAATPASKTTHGPPRSMSTSGPTELQVASWSTVATASPPRRAKTWRQWAVDFDRRTPHVQPALDRMPIARAFIRLCSRPTDHRRWRSAEIQLAPFHTTEARHWRPYDCLVRAAVVIILGACLRASSGVTSFTPWTVRMTS